jgi:hypothetical protein
LTDGNPRLLHQQSVWASIIIIVFPRRRLTKQRHENAHGVPSQETNAGEVWGLVALDDRSLLIPFHLLDERAVGLDF